MSVKFFDKVKDELRFREVARKLLPDFDALRDTDKIAALLCKQLGLQPSEFGKLDAKGRQAFAETALANKKPASTQNAQLDDLVTLNQVAPLVGASKRTLALTQAITWRRE